MLRFVISLHEPFRRDPSIVLSNAAYWQEPLTGIQNQQRYGHRSIKHSVANGTPSPALSNDNQCSIVALLSVMPRIGEGTDDCRTVFGENCISDESYVFSKNFIGDI
jgi:hypothetical protein